ncbi:unnamed protein product [Arabis nemorensis]|uniref:Uncharacterized protein n=1 Tax=Arabis nemorensis TaxID=586526 RepID=A0A565AT51_9BRAS|nr:unnamed protein product [Arabis nemorensis]
MICRVIYPSVSIAILLICPWKIHKEDNSVVEAGQILPSSAQRNSSSSPTTQTPIIPKSTNKSGSDLVVAAPETAVPAKGNASSPSATQAVGESVALRGVKNQKQSLLTLFL